jgi:hypothetical protein
MIFVVWAPVNAAASEADYKPASVTATVSIRMTDYPHLQKIHIRSSCNVFFQGIE